MVKRIAAFAFSPGRLSLIALMLVSLAVWFYGPIVSLGATTPFEGVMTRILSIGLILFVYVGSRPGFGNVLKAAWSRRLASRTIGFLAFAYLVWVVGPIIVIQGESPLATREARILTILATLVYLAAIGLASQLSRSVDLTGASGRFSRLLAATARSSLLALSVVAITCSWLLVLTFINNYTAGLTHAAVLENELQQLNGRLADVAARQAPTDTLDLPLALDAADAVAAAAIEAEDGMLTVLGPSSTDALNAVHRRAYDRTLRNVLEPRMLALLEATMWRQIRDPQYVLGAFKVYQMFTGLAPYDAGFVAEWWQGPLRLHAPIDPFPNAAAVDHQLAAIARMTTEEDRIAPDNALVFQALKSVCHVPLSELAYRTLREAPAVDGLPDWIPAEHAGPNGGRVLTRLSGRTLRDGLPGAFTYDGFHGTILPLIPEIAAQAALDQAVFAGGCQESAAITLDALQRDMLKLYYDDFITEWDSILRDVRLAPLETLAEARDNLRVLAAPDSTLRRLLTAVVAETYLTRPVEDTRGSEATTPSAALRTLERIGMIGRLVRIDDTGVPPGTPVAEHFADIRGAVEEVDGQRPALDSTVRALAALSTELQVVAASADPAAALLTRGGLPRLTAEVAEKASLLPDPLDSWLAGLAGTSRVTREAVVDTLSARWRSNVEPFCMAATRGLYPFDRLSVIDVNLVDFVRLFGPNGLIDSYTNEFLLPYVDVTSRPWKWRMDLAIDAELPALFDEARTMRDSLFSGGAGPVILFTLQLKSLSPDASRVTLNVDGQILAYSSAPSRPSPMTWPGPDGSGMVSLTFTPADGSGEVVRSEVGNWALLRLIDSGELRETELPEVFDLRVGAGGHTASFELRASSIENPFDPTMFTHFSCALGL